MPLGKGSVTGCPKALCKGQKVPAPAYHFSLMLSLSSLGPEHTHTQGLSSYIPLLPRSPGQAQPQQILPNPRAQSSLSHRPGGTLQPCSLNSRGLSGRHLCTAELLPLRLRPILPRPRAPSLGARRARPRHCPPDWHNPYSSNALGARATLSSCRGPSLAGGPSLSPALTVSIRCARPPPASGQWPRASMASAPSQRSPKGEHGSLHPALPAQPRRPLRPLPGPARAPRKWEAGARGTCPGTLPYPGAVSGVPPHRCRPGSHPLGPSRGLPVPPGERPPARPLPPPPSPLTWGAGERLAGALHGPPLGTHFLPPRSTAAAAAHLGRGPAPSAGWASRLGLGVLPADSREPLGLVGVSGAWQAE